MDSRQYIFNKSKLTVKFGNILESQAEVIVSSDDCYVSMGGGVSRAIQKEGGLSIKSDAQKMMPLPLGDVIVTTAGTLEHQKYVYHCINIGISDIGQIDFKTPIASSKKLITSLMYVLNR